MIISINGQPLDATQVTGENLEAILADVMAHHIPADHVIGEVQLNGESYSEDVPHAAVEIDRAGIESLNIITRSPEEIAAFFLKNGSVQIDSLRQALPKIVELFRLGDESEANEHYLRFLESLHLLIGMIESTSQVLGIQTESNLGQVGSLDDRTEHLAGILTQLLDIQQQADWVYLADILEYELAPELGALHRLFPHLQSEPH